MKKLLSLVLALAVLLGCAAFAEGVDYTGTWVLTGVEAEGVQTMVGLKMTMTLNADGTAVMYMMGMEEAGAWVATENGVSVTDASNVTNVFVYQDEMLVEGQDDAVMMFTREGAAPAVAEVAAPVALANVDAAAFEGQWMLSAVNMLGITIPVEETSVYYMAFVLSEGAGIYVGKNVNGELYQMEVNYTVTEVEGTGTVLELIYSGEMVEEPTSLLTLQMLEDGTLYMATDLEGMAWGYYFAQPAAEEAAAE